MQPGCGVAVEGEQKAVGRERRLGKWNTWLQVGAGASQANRWIPEQEETGSGQEASRMGARPGCRLEDSRSGIRFVASRQVCRGG